MEELLFDFKGGNGPRKKRDAEREMDRRAKLQEEKELQDRFEWEARRQKREEIDHWVRKTMEEQEAIMQAQAKQERLEEERLWCESVEVERKRSHDEAETTRRNHLRQPKTCVTCGGDGKCLACSGSGCASVMYLSSAVGCSSQSFRGKTFTGCPTCGGRKDGSELLTFDAVNGNGCCQDCSGLGKTCMTEEEVDAAMYEASGR